MMKTELCLGHGYVEGMKMFRAWLGSGHGFPLGHGHDEGMP